MKENPSNKRQRELPSLNQVMECARRGRAELESRLSTDCEAAPDLAHHVLRKIRSSRDAGCQTDLVGEWVKLSRWAAAVTCAAAIVTVVAAPKPPAPEKPNPLSALGGW